MTDERKRLAFCQQLGQNIRPSYSISSASVLSSGFAIFATSTSHVRTTATKEVTHPESRESRKHRSEIKNGNQGSRPSRRLMAYPEGTSTALHARRVSQKGRHVNPCPQVCEGLAEAESSLKFVR